MTQVKGAQQGAPADRFSAVAPNRRLSFVVMCLGPISVGKRATKEGEP